MKEIKSDIEIKRELIDSIALFAVLSHMLGFAGMVLILQSFFYSSNYIMFVIGFILIFANRWVTLISTFKLCSIFMPKFEGKFDKYLKGR